MRLSELCSLTSVWMTNKSEKANTILLKRKVVKKLAGVKWTPEQEAAINLQGDNILVAAGAGSGKTTVLIQRIINRLVDLENPVDVDKLLVVTFTNAAAAEMKHRLAVALHKAIAQRPQDKHLSRQLSLLQRAQITTLHSFCLDVVRKYSYLLDLDPQSQIADETDLYILKEKVLEDVFEKFYGMENSPLKLLLKAYSRGIDDRAVKNMILLVVEYANSTPYPDEWLNNLAEPYQSGNIRHWVDYMLENVRDDFASFVQMYDDILDICSTSTDGLENYTETLLAEKCALEAVTSDDDGEENEYDEYDEYFDDSIDDGCPSEYEDLYEDWDLYKEKIDNITFGRLPAVRNADSDLKDSIQNRRKGIKDAVKKYQENYFNWSQYEIELSVERLTPVAEALVTLCNAYLAELKKRKKAKKYLEFSDLEHYCLEILADETVAQQLKNEFEEVFVDEYQDINNVQEAVLNAVSRPDNRFMVGDIKQSIYRFRMAEPGLFNAKYNSYEKGIGGIRIDLMDNFRSQSNIIDCINFLFRRLMTGGNLEVMYDQKAELKAGNKDLPRLPVDLLILDSESIGANSDYSVYPSDESFENGSDGGETDPIADMAKAEKEALVIAEKIKEELQNGRKYADFCILLRSVQNVGVVIRDVLQKAGIPCITDGQSNFFETPEIEVAVSLLKIIDNPLQDIDMAAVLHSPVVGLSLAELAKLRILLPGEPLYKAMALSEDWRIKAFYQMLKTFREPMNISGMADFCQRVFSQTGLFAVMSAQSNGELRCENLLELISVAGEYDRNAYGGLYRFITYLEWLRIKGKDSRRQVTSGNAVTVMTIHRSKGLEFPVVFIAGLDKKFNEMDLRNDIILHRDMGLGMRYVDTDNYTKCKTIGFWAIAKKIAWESRAEELRILYVAMTRAKERLILVGTVKNYNSITAKALKSISYTQPQLPHNLVKNCGSYLDWLLLALCGHHDFKDFLYGFVSFGVGGNSKDNGEWRVTVIESLSADGLSEESEEEFANSEFLEANLQKTVIENSVKKQLDWQYPHAAMSQMPIKWSATALNKTKDFVLKTAENSAEENQEVMKDAEEQVKDEPFLHSLEWYAERGTCIHFLLENIDLQKINQGAEPKILFAELLENYNTAEDIKKSVSIAKLACFFRSKIGRGLLKAQQDGGIVLREADFTLVLTIDELAQVFFGKNDVSEAEIREFADGYNLNYEIDRNERVFFQGVIDLCFATAGGWYLVDYKSGSSKDLKDDDVRQKYGSQIMLYNMALSKITGQKIIGKYIYYTSDNRFVEF